MTIDEAIKHCEEVAELNETSAITYKNCKEIKTNMYEKLTAEKAENDCHECAADHRQLAEWLTELKERRSGGWISCKDKLPEPETMVIVASYGSDIVIPEDGETVEECCERLKKELVRVTLGFIGSDGWYASDYFPLIVTPSFWQPLPEPPEGGADDENG